MKTVESKSSSTDRPLTTISTPPSASPDSPVPITAATAPGVREKKKKKKKKKRKKTAGDSGEMEGGAGMVAQAPIKLKITLGKSTDTS